MLVSVVVRCPLGRRDVDTGILMDETDFRCLSADQVRCPACGKLHILERAHAVPAEEKWRQIHNTCGGIANLASPTGEPPRLLSQRSGEGRRLHIGSPL